MTNSNKPPPPDDKKVVKSTSAAPNQNQSQNDQKQSDNDSSSPPAYMQNYATKEDLSIAKGEIIEKMEVLIKKATAFIIGTILGFLGLLITAIGITIAVLTFLSKT